MFDPLELADVAVQIDGRHVGLAVALTIKRHVHPRAQPPTPLAEPTGVDYLDLIEKRHQQELQKRIDYRNLPGPPADGATDNDSKERRDEYRSTSRALGAVAHAVHQGAGDLDAVHLRRSPRSRREDWLDHHRASTRRGLRRGRRRQDSRRPRCEREPGLKPLHDHLPPNPAIGARGIYTQIVAALGATPRFYRATLIPQATDLLAAETAERGKTVLLILDEAHLLSAEQLEELRMLTNAEMDSRATFACLLLGQPTLRRKLRQGVFAALDQRIALRCTIDGMDRKETGDYIAHHVKLAGRSDTLFSDDAVALIHDASRGLPRAVNNLATQTLIAAYAQNKSICDESSARAALAEITAE